MSLVSTFCMPTLLYGIEALNLNVSTLSNLDSPVRQAFYKVFKTFDKVTIDYCTYYTNVSSNKSSELHHFRSMLFQYEFSRSTGLVS